MRAGYCQNLNNQSNRFYQITSTIITGFQKVCIIKLSVLLLFSNSWWCNYCAGIFSFDCYWNILVEEIHWVKIKFGKCFFNSLFNLNKVMIHNYRSLLIIDLVVFQLKHYYYKRKNVLGKNERIGLRKKWLKQGHIGLTMLITINTYHYYFWDQSYSTL